MSVHFLAISAVITSFPAGAKRQNQ